MRFINFALVTSKQKSYKLYEVYNYELKIKLRILKPCTSNIVFLVLYKLLKNFIYLLMYSSYIHILLLISQRLQGLYIFNNQFKIIGNHKLFYL